MISGDSRSEFFLSSLSLTSSASQKHQDKLGERRSAPYRLQPIFALAFVLISAFTIVRPALAEIEKGPLSCDRLLGYTDIRDAKVYGLELTQTFNQFTSEELRFSSGVVLSPSQGPIDVEERLFKVGRYMSAKPLLHSERWELGDQYYRFMNIGFKPFEQYSLQINRAAASHIIDHPHQRLMIEYGPKLTTALKRLKHYRWAAHRAVIDKYREVKGDYLTDIDFWTLENLNKLSDNSDVFGLLADGKGSIPIHLTRKNFLQNLLLTVQVTYYGDRHFFRASLPGILESEGLGTNDSNSLLPFEYRIPSNLLPEIRKEVYGGFRAETTCEITRLAKFMKNLPKALSSRVLLSLLDTIKARGMKTILAAGDPVTGRLFERAGFTQFIIIPTDQSKKKNNVEEYLYFMQVDSEAFNQFHQKLEALAEPSKVVNTDLATP